MKQQWTNEVFVDLNRQRRFLNCQRRFSKSCQDNRAHAQCHRGQRSVLGCVRKMYSIGLET